MPLFNKPKFLFLMICLSLILICIYPKVQFDSRLKSFAAGKQMFPKGLESHTTDLTQAKVHSSNLTNNVKPEVIQIPSDTTSYIKKFDIPPKVFDKNSPFYGMVFTNMYGLPITAIKPTNQSVKEEVVTELWENYFPVLISSIEKDQKQNPNQNTSYFTKAGEITLNKTTYSLGDELVALITSLDVEGGRKHCGGDYYRARLIRGVGNYSDGIPCKVIDNDDGTYTVKAPLALEGLLTLDVKLVLPLQAIKRIINHTSFPCSNTTKYFSRLKSDEIVPCALSTKCLKEKTPLCDYSTPWNNENWLCEKPPSGKCSKITNGYTIRDRKNEQLRWKSNIHLYIFDLKLPQIRIDVKTPTDQQLVMNQSLPKCKEMFGRSKSKFSASVTGYFEGQKWKSLVCQNNVPKSEFQYFQTCLQNKVIYFLGDSTTRQFFERSVKKFSLKVIGSAEVTAWSQPRVAFDKSNLTMYYRAHGHPLQNPGPPFSRPFISDTISNIIVGGNSVYVVFNIGIHFYEINPRTFMQKVKHIRIAIIQHHKKFPETKFIIKGMNVVEPADSWDWALFRYEVILRKYFNGIKNVVFVNLWDLTTVWPLRGNVHPSGTILNQEYLLLFSYICE